MIYAQSKRGGLNNIHNERHEGEGAYNLGEFTIIQISAQLAVNNCSHLHKSELVEILVEG